MRMAAACLALLLAGAAQGEPRPNVIFILADDLGYGDLGCYGQKALRTPCLDRMAAEGTRFTQFYAGSTVCAPSRCVLMTGLHTGHAHVRGNALVPLRAEDVTVAEVLKGAGYATAAIGKWGLGEPETTGLPNRQGFDEWFGFLNQAHAHRHTTDHLWRNGEKVAIDREKDYTQDLFAKAAVDFVRRNRDRPFFLYLALTVPHAELAVPEDSFREWAGKFPEKPYVNKQADEHPSRGYRSQPAPNATLAAMIARMDRDVGRLLDLLRDLGIEGRTAVFFSSDNGPHKEGGRDPAFFKSSGPLRGIKRDLYEGGIRVPLLARWPGRIPGGKVSDHVWGMWDFLPTAAEIAGARGPAGLDGSSMLPALLGRPQRSHEFLYWEFHEGGFHQAVRRGDWKGVRHGLARPLELYDLGTDPGEREDVAAKRPEVVAKIEAYLRTARTDSLEFPVRERR